MRMRPSRWHVAAKHSVILKSILAIISESRTMLMANGHKPTRAGGGIGREQRRRFRRPFLEPRGDALGEVRVELRERFDEAFGMAARQSDRTRRRVRLAATYAARGLALFHDQQFFRPFLEPLDGAGIAVDA